MGLTGPRLPLVIARPCPICGEERIVQVWTAWDTTNGLAIRAQTVRHCGCGRDPPAGPPP